MMMHNSKNPSNKANAELLSINTHSEILTAFQIFIEDN